MNKRLITIEDVLRPIKADQKILGYFQIGGIVISLVLLILFGFSIRTKGDTKWEYLGTALFVFFLLTFLPFMLSRKNRNTVRAIKNGEFSIVVDSISNKTADAKKDKQNGSYRWEYIIEGSQIKDIPKLNKQDWEVCEIGDSVYIVRNSDGIAISAFPGSVYVLSPELEAYLR